MIDLFKKELIEFGTAQLSNHKPKDLNLYKELHISKLLDKYSDKWAALQTIMLAKRQEILTRPEADSVDCETLQTEFNNAIATIRQKFTSAYPLNL